MDALNFDLDAMIAAAVAREDAEIAALQEAERQKKEAEAQARTTRAREILTAALGAQITWALTNISGDGVGHGHARFDYKGVTFDLWKSDVGPSYGIELFTKNDYGSGTMEFVSAPDGILAYIGRKVREQERRGEPLNFSKFGRSEEGDE